MSKISTDTKLKQGRGKGFGADYKPFIKAREFNSMGTCSNFVDWKNGRQMQFLSQTELYVYMQLRWLDDDIDDVHEQYPLDIDRLKELVFQANQELQASGQSLLKVKYDSQHWLTSDLVIYRDKSISEVISVKYNKNDLSEKDIETIWIEKKYWNERGIPLTLMDRSDVNLVLVQNLRLVLEYYDLSKVHDKDSLIKHYIATKKLAVDIGTKPLDMREIKQMIEEKKICLPMA